MAAQKLRRRGMLYENELQIMAVVLHYMLMEYWADGYACFDAIGLLTLTIYHRCDV